MNIIKKWNFGDFNDCAGMVATLPLKELIGNDAVITGCAIVEKNDAEKNEIIKISIIRTVDGKYYGGVSNTVRETLEMLTDSVPEGTASVTITVEERPARSGRNFLMITKIAANS